MPKARAYLENGTLELDNNICERSIRLVTLGRKNYLFMGSKGGGEAAAIAYTLIETCRMNKVDPKAWLAWVLARVADHNPARWRTGRARGHTVAAALPLPAPRRDRSGRARRGA